MSPELDALSPYEVLCGVFLSNRYFVECFLHNLHSAYNSTVKPLILHFVWRIEVDVTLPHYFHPANILLCMATAATNVGVVGMTPLQTPKDFADSCLQQPCSTVPICAIQSDEGASAPPVATTAVVDICHLNIDDNILVTICSLAAANPCTCNICGAIDHMIATCPCLQKMMSDPARACCVVNVVQQGCTSRGGSTMNSKASTASFLSNSAQA